MNPDCGIVGEGVVGIMVVGMPCEEGVTATPGFIREIYDYYRRRRRDEEERPERRPEPSREEVVREYAERSDIIDQALEKLRAEAATLTAETDELRARIERASTRKAQARLDHELMLREQAAALAAAQEAALLQEQELNEVVSMVLMYDLISTALAARAHTLH